MRSVSRVNTKGAKKSVKLSRLKKGKIRNLSPGKLVSNDTALRARLANGYIGTLVAEIKRVENNGTFVAVDGRQRSHNFDIDEIVVSPQSQQKLPLEVGEKVTISVSRRDGSVTVMLN